jgi:hypothetical protein
MRGKNQVFADAYEIAKGFTRPVVISDRTLDGAVCCGIGTFVVINRDGWIATAAHILDPMVTAINHRAERATHEQQLTLIKTDPSLSPSQRKNRINQLTNNPKWITNQSYWWAFQQNVIAKEIYVDALADVAILRLENFDTSGIASYPVLKKATENPRFGTSLCRLGFPFHTLEHCCPRRDRL